MQQFNLITFHVISLHLVHLFNLHQLILQTSENKTKQTQTRNQSCCMSYKYVCVFMLLVHADKDVAVD